VTENGKSPQCESRPASDGNFQRNAEIIPQWLDHAMKSPALRDQIELGASGTSSAFLTHYLSVTIIHPELATN